MAVDITEERPAAVEVAEPSPPAVPALQRARIQLDVVAQRDEVRIAVARVLRERWRQKAAASRAEEDARGAADWLDMLSEHTLRSVSEESVADRQFALTQIAATALAALESSQRRHGERRGMGELES